MASNKVVAWIKKNPGTSGALAAFFVTTVFNVLAAIDSKEAAEASRDSAKSSAESVALEKTPTLLTSCSISGQNTDAPNAPTPIRLLISKDPKSKFNRVRISSTDVDPSEVTPAPKTFEWCHLFNYGRLPVINVYLTYDVLYRSMGSTVAPKSYDFSKTPASEKYTIYVAAVPASSEQSFRIVNMGPEMAAPLRENQFSYQAPPNYTTTYTTFPEQRFEMTYLKPNTGKVVHP